MATWVNTPTLPPHANISGRPRSPRQRRRLSLPSLKQLLFSQYAAILCARPSRTHPCHATKHPSRPQGAGGGTGAARIRAKKKGPARLREVEIDGLVVLKIIKHCREFLPEVVTGQLLGLDQDGSLEVTNCFAFPKDDSAEAADNTAQYQREMMVRLREVNVDSNTVGWYQSSYMGSIHDPAMVQSQFNYQSQIRNCVCLVYDPLRSNAQGLSLKAYRLTDTFMSMYKSGKFSQQGGDLPGTGVFEELPIKVKNGFMIAGLLRELEGQRDDASMDFSGVDAAGADSTAVEKSLEAMHDCVDDLTEEQRRYSLWQRDSQRLAAQQQAIIAKRKAEGQAVDPAMFKELPEPSRLESLLISNQIGSYATQLSQFSAQGMSKSFLMQGLAKDK